MEGEGVTSTRSWTCHLYQNTVQCVNQLVVVVMLGIVKGYPKTSVWPFEQVLLVLPDALTMAALLDPTTQSSYKGLQFFKINIISEAFMAM